MHYSLELIHYCTCTRGSIPLLSPPLFLPLLQITPNVPYSLYLPTYQFVTIMYDSTILSPAFPPSSSSFSFLVPTTLDNRIVFISLSFFLSFLPSFLSFSLRMDGRAGRGFHHHSFLGFNLHTWWRFPFILYIMMGGII